MQRDASAKINVPFSLPFLSLFEIVARCILENDQPNVSLEVYKLGWIIIEHLAADRKFSSSK